MKRFSLVLTIFSLLVYDGNTQRRGSSSTTPKGNVDTYSNLKWRNIGPPRGGRANTISGVITDDQTYYAGYTGGGVWKTTNGGNTWNNISDGFFTTGSIGDIAVSESDPNVVYVGSGEHAVRGVMTSYGDGVYKSTDAGKTWSNIGLRESMHISDVRVHPKDHDVVYVGVQGAVHGPSAERGVYRSTDGGESWSKVLYINENTGISSLVMDMNNPRILYAATWQHRRYPWMVESGGPGSSVYKSTDGGDTWKKIIDGLPESMGKIGLSVSRANSELVYALIESEKSVAGLYKSTNGGIKWEHMTNDQTITARSWYYMEVFADPVNENVVYALNAPLMKSIDGGKTFQSMRVIHGDCHDFWINPADNDNYAMAEDGGATVTYNNGDYWSDINNQSTAQFYRINADEQVPYWVYSGQQDNLSVAIPSRTPSYGILTRHWFNGPGCESAFVTFDDPENPRILYGGCFNGRISLLDTKTMETKDIQPYPSTNLGYDPKDMKYRFNWNAPLINSPHDARTMYYGGNVVFKTTNGGLFWEIISPDLTRNDTIKQGKGGGPFTNEGAGGENYNTLYYIAESPHEQGVIYTGSDGGLLHITRDGGSTWQNITPSGLPETMIHSIEVSPNDPATVYFASTRYKFNDQKNYSYKSTDYGQTWKKIGDDIQEKDFFRVIREDPKVPGLLYAGAERGFYVSFNGGSSFQQMQLNFPVVPITDLIIRDNDLAASTAGRGFWIFDDLSSIQQSKGMFSSNVELYQPKAHYRIFAGRPFYLITEKAFGENPSIGVHLDYYLGNFNEDDSLKLEILNSDDEVIRTVTGTTDPIELGFSGGRGYLLAANTDKLPMKKGVNRFTWDFRTDGVVKVPNTFIFQADYRGHRVAPGSYKARMTLNGETSEVPIVIMNPPGLEIPEEIWQQQQSLLNEIELRINEMHERINVTMEMNERMKTIQEQIKDDAQLQELKKAAEELDKKIEDWQSQIIELRQKNFQDVLNWPAGLNSEYFLLKGNLDTYNPEIPQGYLDRFDDVKGMWDTYKTQYEILMDQDVKQFNDMYKEMNVPVLQSPKLQDVPNN